MKKYDLLIIAMVAGIGIMAVVFGSDIVKMSVPAQDYDLFVDPIIDKQNLFDIGRVTIQNTGLKPLTNIHINFGDGDTMDLKILEPGDKILLSPPSENSLVPPDRLLRSTVLVPPASVMLRLEPLSATSFINSLVGSASRSISPVGKVIVLPFEMLISEPLILRV